MTWAIDLIKPNSVAMDVLLGLLVSEPVGGCGWHQFVKLDSGVEVFDLIDGRSLGRGYRSRSDAKHVTQKAAEHWAKHQVIIRQMITNVAGKEELLTEKDIFTAIGKAKGHMRAALYALLDVHRSRKLEPDVKRRA
jgi:hypothetical protein